ncbi:MAG: hypothetical protein JHC37_02950 [Campylobacteraceae bacterium]|jgi:hypothetical protein|nr:hypothetical protein [Campylobacteraceae bacterium]
MEFNLDKLHNAIDEIFENRKGSEKAIFYATPFILFAFLSYQFLIPISEKRIADKKRKFEQLRTEIDATKEYLKRKNELLSDIKLIQETNKALVAKLQSQISKNRELENSLQSIDFINLSEKNILEFVDETAESSAKYGVVINSLKTSLLDKENGVFKKELRVDLNCSGEFKGILGFANALESSQMFSKIEKIKIDNGKKLNAEITVTVSGL